MQTTKISNGMNKTLSWAARAFAILFIIMTALFALDLKQFSWVGLFVHLLPSLILLVILGISWVQEKLGGILWILAAIAYVVIVWGSVTWSAYLMMLSPMLIIALLFLWPKNQTMHIPKPSQVISETSQLESELTKPSTQDEAKPR